ncbi:RNA polymerase subunit sigma-70 (plasmid) [Priestia filamentosa]|uniref:RNA polymerase subunit sigma-70 n=1 Tax=Priestia filamentosa TaxID=1402861 RepID=A0A2S1LZR7_9BACI|nr:RNA polymerase sigma factor [Priestia filamentosa]AWG44309.1 RNA polymerase subunit sigma-70 [Priestia filamentosa]
MYDQTFQKQLNQQLSIIFRYLVKIGCNKEDAEDIVQEAAIKYIENIESISPHKVKNWLFRVSINRYYDLVRRHKVRDKSLLKLQVLENIQADLPEDLIIQKETFYDIRKVLELLPERSKHFLTLKYILNLRYEDIAELFEISPGTVKTSVFRAKKAFIEAYRRIENE